MTKRDRDMIATMFRFLVRLIVVHMEMQHGKNRIEERGIFYTDEYIVINKSLAGWQHTGK